MTVTKEAYLDIEEKFLKIIQLMEDDSKTDPPNNPYRSKYNARQLLIGAKANIENLRRSQSEDSREYIRLSAMLSLSLFYLAKIASDTEETSAAGKYVLKCLEIIDNFQTEPEFIIITVSTLNLQALLNSNNEPELSKSCLEKCVLFYKQFKMSGKVPINLSDLFKVNVTECHSESGIQYLEKTHTLTIYYLAQIYGALKDDLKSSIYCHITLKRQLQYNDYEPMDWLLNAATLSQFFIEKICFKQARHLLAASLWMLQKYEDQLNTETRRDEEYEAQLENFRHRSADIARCWAKYGIGLLSISQQRLLKQAEDSTFDISTDLANLDLTDSNISKEDTLKLEFDIDIQNYENQVTSNFLLTLEDAQPVFLNVKLWLSKAHEYYTLNNLASDYIEIVQDQSQMYLNLLFFYDDPGNQAKLHKRRIDLLEDILKKINPKYYMPYCRQLWFEVAGVYRDIFYIKREQLQETKEYPAPHTLTKINSLINKGIVHFKNFIKSFEDEITKELPKTIDSDYEKSFLMSFFGISALSNRFITLDKTLILENTQASYNAYKYIVDYCERNTHAAEEISSELDICREMVFLLPVRIAKLTEDLQS